MENGHHIFSDGANPEKSADKHKNLSKEGATSPTGHKRSLSGNISAYIFQRSSSQVSKPATPETVSSLTAQDGLNNESSHPQSVSTAMAMVTQQKARKRKGSLRKTALLGTGKLRAEEKERELPQSQLGQTVVNELDLPITSYVNNNAASSSIPSPGGSFDMPTPRPISSVPPPVPMVTHPVLGDPSKISSAQGLENNKPYPTLPRPPVAGSTASTTDEENSPTSPPAESLPSLLKKAADSYFPPQPLHLLSSRPTTASSRSSPLASLPPTVPSPPPSEWDYSETRWWGWFILIVTWIVFVVGMGSCFEVWAWAWDVGETPSAPPEFEDDPTLPIVGYYPALIILTAVVAWVWVTIAWVGMKYFRHANIPGDEESS